MNALAKAIYLVGQLAKKIRSRVRNQYYRHLLRHFGEGSQICEGVFITTPWNVSMGKGVQINGRVHVLAREDAPVDIGDGVVLSYEAMLLTAGLAYTGKIKKRAHRALPIVIENDVWIGARAIILPGVRLGRNAVVAAGSMVTKDVAPNTLVAGIPATFKKMIQTSSIVEQQTKADR